MVESCAHEYILFFCCLEELDGNSCFNALTGCDGFRCANGLCVNSSLVCDNSNGCGDWSDEDYCGKCEDIIQTVKTSVITVTLVLHQIFKIRFC